MPDDLEIHVRESDVGRVVDWGRSLLGPLRDVSLRPDESIHHDRAGHAFTVTPRIGGTDFSSVWISPADASVPFASDVGLARAAHRALGVEARCRPGELLPGATPAQLWSVSGNGERVVEWWTPDDMIESGWFEDAWAAVGAAPRPGLVTDLVARYAEAHRAYHTMLHLSEACSALAETGARVQRRSEAGIALWFHDAIYDTRRHDNEERSADWARDELLAAGAASDAAARVHALVLATKHREPPEGSDARLLVDADLSILAAPPDRFAAYERQIRQEYGWVPEPEFRAAREKFLRGMLARPSIFSDAAMRERHEAHARRNLGDALRFLGTASA